MCFVVEIRSISYCASLRGHTVLISNVGLEEPVQIWHNSTLGWGLMAVAYVKSTSSACASSCVVSWVRGFWTAPRQLKSLKRADELQHCSSPVKRSPRTNTEGGRSHSCVRKGARTPLIFFFNLPRCAIWIASITSDILPVERYGKPGIDPMTAVWSVLPLFFCLFLFLRHFWGTFCLSFLLRWHAQPSLQLPPATREAANLGRPHGRPRQMSPSGHWAERRGHGGWVAEQSARERAPNRDVRPGGKPLALVVIIFGLTQADPFLCRVQVR